MLLVAPHKANEVEAHTLELDVQLAFAVLLALLLGSGLVELAPGSRRKRKASGTGVNEDPAAQIERRDIRKVPAYSNTLQARDHVSTFRFEIAVVRAAGRQDGGGATERKQAW